ncbi:MAG: fructose-1,6-bisphosphatase [Methylibium sp.]|nr:fructose-1,6-bisphosphatase [Methylibium sp.]
MDTIDLEQWLAAAPRPLAELLRQLACACARIARTVARGAPEVLASEADASMRAALAGCPHVAGWASGPQCRATVSPEHGSGGAYLVMFEPLDGAAELAANGPLGSVFSVLPHLFRGTPASDAAFMQPGRRLLAAGYALYGPQTVLVLSIGQGVHVFTLDGEDRSEAGRWRLTRTAVQVPAASTDFAIDFAMQRFWEKPVQRYVGECLAGSTGPRGRDFAMGWTTSLAAEVHRIVGRGGVFLAPRDSKPPYRPGPLRLMVEAAPMAWLMEQAGAGATNGTSALLDLVPDALHQKVPVILGSRDEVERIAAYHADPSENVSWQLFKTRSLFVPSRL